MTALVKQPADMALSFGLELEQKAVTPRWTLRVITLGLIASVVWMHFANIEQFTRASAQVIPQGRTHTVQAAETGVLVDLKVTEGQNVTAGELIASFEAERAEAALDDTNAKVAASRLALIRLEAEVFGRPLQIPPALLSYTELVDNQTNLYQKRRQAVQQELGALQRSLDLAKEEWVMLQKLEKAGDVGRSETLKLERATADIEGQITNRKNKFFQDAQAEMTKVQEELNTLEQQQRDRKQVMEHMRVYAPASGVIKSIRLSTPGAVARAGDPIMEIVPTEAGVIIEAKVSPTDIAGMHVGQMANIKLDAYDYTIYGDVAGTISYIGPDTIVEDGRQANAQPF
jgi:adhesin transport system membrane fusion protein